MSRQSAARELGRWCSGLRVADVPGEVDALNRLRVLDTLGLIIAGGRTKAVSAVRASVLGSGGAETSSLLGEQRRVPAAQAALVHGTAAHCHDFDDTFSQSVVHAGSFVIPTALAVAEAGQSSAEEFSLAITVGYEVAARLGAVAGRKFHARHFHPSAVVGPIASAAVSARLMHLDERATTSAMGLAASMSGGLRAFAVDGAWSKWLHLGWASHAGIVAAELASRGFVGPEYVLDGGWDLYSAFLHGEEVDRKILTDGLGMDWKGAEAEFKYYPCAHVIQPFIGALLQLMDDNCIGGADLDRIECRIAPWAAAIVCEPREAKLRFSTEIEATGSLPYQLAYAALSGRPSLEALSAQSRNRSDLAAFSRRVTHISDPTLGRRFEGEIILHTRRGDRLALRAELPGIDAAKLKQKFLDLVAPTVGMAEAGALVARLSEPAAGWRAAAAAFRSGPLV